MTSDTPSVKTADSSSTGNSGSSTAINALIGVAASIILSFISLSTLLGGAIAKYLENGEPRDGLKVGALSGSLASTSKTSYDLF